MEQAKKVNAEVVGERKKSGQRGAWHSFKIGLVEVMLRLKLIIAILMDAADLVLANIPIVNTLWDFATMAVLLLILRNKWLAVGAMAELPLVGLPILGQIDALIPMATILTLVDIAETRMHYSQP